MQQSCVRLKSYCHSALHSNHFQILMTPSLIQTQAGCAALEAQPSKEWHPDAPRRVCGAASKTEGARFPWPSGASVSALLLSRLPPLPPSVCLAPPPGDEPDGATPDTPPPASRVCYQVPAVPCRPFPWRPVSPAAQRSTSGATWHGEDHNSTRPPRVDSELVCMPTEDVLLQSRPEQDSCLQHVVTGKQVARSTSDSVQRPIGLLGAMLWLQRPTGLLPRSRLVYTVGPHTE